MARLLIERSKGFTNSMSKYNVFIDGVKVGGLANGEMKEFEVSEGPHTLCAKVSWYSSPTQPVTVANGETRNYKVGAGKMAYIPLISLAIFFLTRIFMRLNSMNPDTISYIMLPLIIVSLAVMIIYRKKYLTITEQVF